MQTDLATTRAVSRFEYNRDPLGARIAGIVGEAQAELDRIGDPKSADAQRVSAARDAAVARERYEDDDRRRMLGIDQEYSSRALQRGLARDPIGARGWQTVGSTLGRVAQLEQMGPQYADAVQRERRLGFDEIGLQRQSYADAFRAVSVDAWNNRFDNPRDSQNPADVFAQFQKQQDDIMNAEALQTRQPQQQPGGGGASEETQKAILYYLQTLDHKLGELTAPM